MSINKKYYEDYETDTTDANGIPNIDEGKEYRVVTRTINIGSKTITMQQARNALYKAVEDSIYDKKYGLLAKMDGVGKRRRV